MSRIVVVGRKKNRTETTVHYDPSGIAVETTARGQFLMIGSRRFETKNRSCQVGSNRSPIQSSGRSSQNAVPRVGLSMGPIQSRGFASRELTKNPSRSSPMGGFTNTPPSSRERLKEIGFWIRMSQ